MAEKSNDGGPAAGHTKGPWRAVVRSNQHGIQSVAVDMLRRGVWKPARKLLTAEDIANAHLIATTPNLLDVLHDATVALAAILERPEDETRWPHAQHFIERARAVIACAEGRS